MTWWAWTLLWVVLVVGALGVFFLVGRSLWRKATALINELSTAAERLSAVSEELGALTGDRAEPVSPQPPAVFSNPTSLRQERFLARRGGAAARRR